MGAPFRRPARRLSPSASFCVGSQTDRQSETDGGVLAGDSRVLSQTRLRSDVRDAVSDVIPGLSVL